jgi:capsular polysaccharide transport system permease protein
MPQSPAHPAQPQTGAQAQARTNRRFAAVKSVMALMIREMATRYGRSPGGYVWAILEPMGAILILAIGFSIMLRSPPLGNSFILFYATGFLPFSLYQSLSNHVARSINFSRALLMYPAVTWVDAVLARFTLNALTEILVTVILLGALLSLTDTRVALDGGLLLQALVLAMAVGLGVGVMNCALIGLFPVWMQIWSILSRPLFLVSGVIFLFDDMPPVLQSILWYNPLTHVLGLMRAGIYPTYRADYVTLACPMIFALATLFVGVLLMGRYHREILNDG